MGTGLVQYRQVDERLQQEFQTRRTKNKSQSIKKPLPTNNTKDSISDNKKKKITEIFLSRKN